MERRRVRRPRRPFVRRTCVVCWREYEARVERTNLSWVYRGTCPWCGTTDYSVDGKRGHLEFAGHAEAAKALKALEDPWTRDNQHR